jgi:hypothetical protein
MSNGTLSKTLFLIAIALIFTEDVASDTSDAAPEPGRLGVSFTDLMWDGKTVPKGKQCQRFGGRKPSTPPLTIKGLPPGTNAIIMEYSDRSYPPMDNGGHGQIGYEIPEGMKEVIIPSVRGHSFDLPEGFFTVAPHQAPGWDKAGAYLPPCSGGRGNSYYVTVKAAHRSSGDSKEFELLDQAVLELGTY